MSFEFVYLKILR